MHKWKKYIFISDILALYLALVLAVIVRGLVHVHAKQTEEVWISAHTKIFLPALLFSLLALYIAGLYDPKIIYDRVKTLALLLYTQLATALFSILSFYVFRTSLTPKLTIFFYVIFSVILVSLSRSYVFNAIQKLEKIKAIFFGNNKSLLENLNPNYAPFSFVLLEKPQDVEKELDAGKINYIVYDEKLLSDMENILFIGKLKSRGYSVFSYNQYYEFLYRKVDMQNLYFDDLIRQIAENKESVAHFLFRRFVDIFLAIIILPFFLLSIPVVYIANMFFNKGDLFSVQDRVGLLGKRVWIYKFRTMLKTDSGSIMDANGKHKSHEQTGNGYTKIGAIWRKTRVDELPQCINFFKGDISLIGPRADIIGVHNDMSQHILNYKLRLLVPQGLTGWAQVHMTYPPRTHAEHAERLAYELYYIRNKSILLDISIILKTIKTVISRTGQ